MPFSLRLRLHFKVAHAGSVRQAIPSGETTVFARFDEGGPVPLRPIARNGHAGYLGSNSSTVFLSLASRGRF